MFSHFFASEAARKHAHWCPQYLNRAERWDVYVNNVQQVGDTLPGDGSDNRASADTFNLANFVLGAGDTVELRITTLGSAGDFVTVSMSVEMTPAPEPTSLALLATGLAAVSFRRRYRSA